MAKISWERVKREKDIQDAREATYNDPQRKNFGMFLDSGIWALKGKYYGQSVKTLPLSYLGWVIDNVTGIHKDIAEKEIYRRYQDLSNT